MKWYPPGYNNQKSNATDTTTLSASYSGGGTGSGGGSQIPAWLQGQMDEYQGQMGQLQGVYAQIPQAFDSTGTVNALNNQIGFLTGAGRQASSNAATEYATRAAQSGGSALGAGAVRAQTMLPFLEAGAGMRTQGEQIKQESRQQGFSAAASLATTMAQLRKDYLSSLSDMYLKNRQLDIDERYRTGVLDLERSGQNLEREKLEAQLAMARSDAALRALAAGIPKGPTGLLGITGPGGVMQYAPGMQEQLQGYERSRSNLLKQLNF